MVGPNKQFNQQEALSKALNVFWNKGYEATSMQDLVSSMGINRASMYQTYGNKHELFLSSLDLYISTSLAGISQMLETFASSSNSSVDAVQRVFESMIEFSMDGDKSGCFINNTAIELATHNPEIAEIIRDFWKSFEAVFTPYIKTAIQNDEIDSAIDAEQISALLNINIQGFMVKTKTNATKASLFQSIQSLFDLIRKRAI